MKTLLYLLAAGLFVAVVAVVLAAVLLGLRRALRGAASGNPVPRRALPLTAAALAFWLGLTAALAAAGALSFDARPPRLLLLLPLPLLATVLLARSAAVGRLLDALPRAGLLYLQSMRVAVELVLWLLFLAGAVPRQMTFEGLNWDVLTGLTAPVVAYFCFTRRSWPWQVAVGWNVLGLALLLNIVTIALLSAPTPFRQFWNEPANVVISQFPFVWLPLFIVPVAYTSHVLSLRQLWRRAANTATPLPETAAPTA
ncbi:hypothetical protein [Hymenobacter jeollabukensis]|uniref:Uncharacterized protein n=1 Tax=Hymenobacter jeollabukensis TaxID=2025313 RepID=A0A5R8WMS5_9BACT|nr:hypothetical protein [Hymenobacter jeollabukensis]TLM90614.1 hypothetical protein FDY95_18075 [Hymenobacter jeollabukensis]